METKNKMNVLKRLLSVAMVAVFTAAYLPFATDLKVSASDTSANLAAGKSVFASTTYGSNTAEKAVDSDASTRWESEYSDIQWIYVVSVLRRLLIML